jgi:competence protein ComEA
MVMIFCGIILHYLGLTADDTRYEGQLDTLIVRQQLVDIRTADAGELATLPRIGEKLAERIILYRQKTPFTRIEDLEKVRGIGSKTMERLKPYLIVFGAESEGSSAKTSSAASDSLIDINRAGLEELMRLKGIGEVKAQRIIDRRKELGKFSNVDELLSVKGIGEKTLAKLKRYIKCER